MTLGALPRPRYWRIRASFSFASNLNWPDEGDGSASYKTISIGDAPIASHAPRLVIGDRPFKAEHQRPDMVVHLTDRPRLRI